MLAAADEFYFLVWVYGALLFCTENRQRGITTVEINLVSSSSVFHSKWQKSQKEKSPSSLSLSDRSTADVVECADVDYATGSFCSSCSIPPPMAHGFWSSGKGFAMCNFDDNCGG